MMLPRFISITLFCIYYYYISLRLALARINSPLVDKYEGYGEEWIFMPNGNGQPQVAVLRGFDNGSRTTLGDDDDDDDDDAISYILFTRNNPEIGQPLFLHNVQALKGSGFSSSKKTKIITHGWKSSALSANQIGMKNAYLEHDDYNVILVDWHPLAASTFYLGPMRNTKKVGQSAAKFIDFLVNETGLSVKDVHFIGHSLGAHVAGNAGSAVKSGRIGRVTGLDPALPGFHIFTTEKERLDPSDAAFVDVIHSCGGILGYLQPLGHIDFYPNAGVAVQPGCCCLPEIMEACSHGRSYAYFIESINPKSGFWATKCDSWDNYINKHCGDGNVILMGEHVDKTVTGSYFLKTRSEPPFAYSQDIENNII